MERGLKRGEVKTRRSPKKIIVNAFDLSSLIYPLLFFN
jgi:hypothetical protein